MSGNDRGAPLYFALVPVHSVPEGAGATTCVVTGRRLAETGGGFALSPEAMRILGLAGAGELPGEDERDVEAALSRVVRAMEAPETPRSLEEAIDAARGTLAASRGLRAVLALRGEDAVLDMTKVFGRDRTPLPPGGGGNPHGAVVPRDTGRFSRLSEEPRAEIPEGYSAELEHMSVRRRPRPYGERDADWPAGTAGGSWPASRMGYLRWLAGRLEGYGNELQEPIASLVRDGLVTLVERSRSVATRITSQGVIRLLAEDRDEAYSGTLPGIGAD